MSIQFVAATSGEGTTLTPPAHQAGDLFVLFFYDSSSLTIPTPPAGWLRGGNRRVGGTFPRIGSVFYKTATSNAEAVGTWPSAALAMAVYRDSDGNCLSLVETGNTTANPGANITFQDAQSITAVGNTGNRACAAATGWVVLTGGVNGNPGASTPPSGFTNRVHGVGTDEVVIHDTNADVSSTSAASVAMGASAYTATCTAQIFDTGIAFGGDAGGGTSRTLNWRRPPMNIYVGDTIPIDHRTFDAAGTLADADSTPSVVVVKNGTATLDVVAVTNPSTGVYAITYDPAGEAVNDHFVLKVTSVVGGVTTVDEYSANVVEAMRGTDNALTAVGEVNVGSVKGAAVASVDDFKATGFAVAGDAMTLTSAERTAVAGGVDTVLTTTHGSGTWTTAISSGGGATAQEVWEYSTRGLTEDVTTDAASRTASQADVSGIVGSEGTGARTVTLTVRNTDGDLIPGATVRMKKGGENYSKTLLTGTDSVGRDDGIWTVTTTAVNHSSDVRSVTISADTPIEITLTAVTIQAPAASGTATGVALVLDETNQPEAGVECSAVLVNGNGSTGKFRTSEEWKATSDGDGLVQWNALEHGATYRFYRGGRYASSDYVEATIAAVQSFEIGELVA